MLGVGEPRTDGVLTSASIRRKSQVKGHTKGLCKPLVGRGELITLTMRLFTDESFIVEQSFDENSQEATEATDLKSHWYKNVFYEISLSTNQKQHIQNARLVPVFCYATPDADPNNKMNYVYISDG